MSLPPHGNQPASYDDLDAPQQPSASRNAPMSASQTAPLPQSALNQVIPPYFLPVTPNQLAPNPDVSTFPSYAELVGCNPLQHLASYSRAPWFFPAAVRNEGLITTYVVAGRRPDGLPWFALYTSDWLSHCALPDVAISRYQNESMAEARRQFVRLVYLRMRRVIGTVPLNEDLKLDTWVARTNGEAYAYVENLPNLDIRQWRGGRGGVSNAALCFDNPQLRAEFCYLCKRDIHYWEYPRWERQTRSRLGYLVPYQMLEIDRIRYRSRIGRYISIARHWHEIECPRSGAVEPPPALTYVESLLKNDPFLGYWVVVYTEFIAKMALYVLWDVYDTYRLWYMTPTARRYARELDLSFILGSRANQEEFRRLVDIIDQVNWSLVPVEQSSRGNPRVHHSPGRNGPGGDFIWYDPWTSQHIDGRQAKQLRENPRAMPPTQPTGYLFEPMPMNSDALVDEYQEIANDVAMGEPKEEVDAPNDGTDVEHFPAAMQESAPAPDPLLTLQGEAELHCVRCLLLDAGVSPG